MCRVVAGIPHHLAVGLSDCALRQPRPILQLGTFVFEALSIVLLGLEGKITLVELDRDENLAVV